MNHSRTISATPCEHDHSGKSVSEQVNAARKICEQQDERFTPLRAHIYELIVRADGPIKAYDLLEQLRPERGSPKPPTVYRALDFFARLGLVHRVEALNAYIACDHTHPGHVAEFFICERCDEVKETHAHSHDNCAPNGFVISSSVIEHYGLCETCALAA